MAFFTRACVFLLCQAVVLVPLVAAANCLPIVQRQSGIAPASFRMAEVEKGTLALTFLGHASWLIQTAGGVSAVTDYNGWIRPPRLPDIVTMNRAHSTHYTDTPEPEIKHVLRGWAPDGGMAQHFVKYGDMRVRNVPTNIRSYNGTQRNGNSIFIFEAGDLCVAHLGHLHHTLTDTHLTELGQIDVVLAPVDGGYTIDHEGIVEALKQIKAPLVLPMHYFTSDTLASFLTAAQPHYAIEHHQSTSITLSRSELPKTPTIRILPGR